MSTGLILPSPSPMRPTNADDSAATLVCACGVRFMPEEEWLSWEPLCPACTAEAKRLLRTEIDSQRYAIEVADAPIPECSVWVVDEAEPNSETYDFIPEHVHLQDAPRGTRVVSPSFWGDLGLVKLPERPTGMALASRWALVGADCDVRILDMRAVARSGAFGEHRAPVTSLALSRDGRLALTGDERGTLIHWDTASRRVCRRIRGHLGPVLALTFLPDADYAISCGADGAVIYWDLLTGRKCYLADAAWGEAVTSVSCSADGRLLAAAGSEGRVQLWDLTLGQLVQRMTGAYEPIDSVRIGADGSTVVATALPADVKVRAHPRLWTWRLDQEGPQLRRNSLGKPYCIPTVAALDRTGSRLLVAGYYPIVDPSKPFPFLEEELVHSGFADAANWLTRECLPRIKFYLLRAGVASTITIHCLEVWSLSTAIREHAFTDINGEITRLEVSQDNTRVLAGLANGNVQAFALGL